MNAAPTEPGALVGTKLPGEGAWPWSRWVLLILLAFVAHIGLIFALSERKPIVPRPPAAAPALRLLTGGEDWLALNDPTLFALPHARGFAGAAWLKMPRVKFPSFEWSEPPRWLPLPVEQLGGTFLRFMQTNAFVQLAFEARPPPLLSRPAAPPDGFAPLLRSTVRVEGELTARPWLNPPPLPPWSGTDLPADSVVQVLVDAAGNVRSATLLPPFSGSKTNDQLALGLARNARFAPLAGDAAKLNLGTLIFSWQGAPTLVTNPPATTVQP